MTGSSMERTSIFLLSILLSHVRASVPPVTNVTLDCRNFENTLRWTYSHESGSPTPRFRVNVISSNRIHEPMWVDYPELQCDLSSFSEPDNEYLLNVMAVVGLEESPVAPPDGLTFSYYQNSLATVKCTLDLPSVNVTAQSEVGIRLRFSHPSVVYHPKLVAGRHRQQRKPGDQRAKKNLSMFNYMVFMTSNKSEYTFSCVTSVCEENISVALLQQPGSNCVKINGDWKKIAVRGTGDYCAQAVSTPAGPFVPGYLYITLAVLSVTVICVGLILLCYFKNVSGFASLPAALYFTRSGQDTQKDLIDAPLNVNHPCVTPVSTDPSATSPLPAEEELEIVDLEFLLPLGNLPPPAVPAAPSDHPAAAAAADGGRPQQPYEGVREGVGDDEAVQNNSGYEQRARLVTTVEIAAGDKVDAYQS